MGRVLVSHWDTDVGVQLSNLLKIHFIIPTNFQCLTGMRGYKLACCYTPIHRRVYFY